MKELSFAGRCLTESLTANTAPFVSMLLTVPLIENGTNLNYLLPVMLFYACMKTGLYLLQGTVRIENPYRMMKYGIFTALIGSFFLLCGDPTSGFYLVGSLITGIGLSAFPSLYKLVTESLEGENEDARFRKITSTMILLLIVACCVVCRKAGNHDVLYLWCLYLGIICLYITLLPGREKFAAPKTAILKKKWQIHTVSALLVFFMMTAVSGYKSSGNLPMFVLMLVALGLFVIWSILFDDRGLHWYCAQTAWLGAIRGFEMLFVLVFLTNTQQGSLTIGLYAVILTAGFFGTVTDVLFRTQNEEKIVWSCMAVALSCMLLVISRNIPLMFFGVFLCVCFTNRGKSGNLRAYRGDSTVFSGEYWFRQDKMFALGNGFAQAFTMMVFYAVGRIISGHGNDLMQSYVFHSEAEQNGTVLLVSGIVCILSLFVWLAAIRRTTKAQENEQNRASN